MVRTNQEEKFKNDAAELKREFPFFSLYFFKKTMRTNKGKIFTEPIFPGYVFLSAENLDGEFVSRIKKIPGFVKFLLSNQNICEMKGESLFVVEKFLSFGENLGLSELSFQEGRRIVIKSGPLQGLEGNIVAVNKRQRRVTLRLDMMPGVSKIDMCYDDITEAE
jgi:transcriptional antiterminator NusG